MGQGENKFYYTRENGGLKQYNQPLSLSTTTREGFKLNKGVGSIANIGPGYYNPALPQDI